MYTGILGNFNRGDMCIPDAELDLVCIFVEKYDLIGVVGFVNYLSSSQEIEHLNKVNQAEEKEIELGKAEQKRWKLQSGAVVDYMNRLPIRTRVIYNEHSIHNLSNKNKKPKPRGIIIVNNEDGGTEIGVRWDDRT